ncbi:hypothetical protein [Marinomonas sp. ef1]|uniref:hypothetical protein n=1 Tax=Marinomonas sp. ef1 TaxID=2005043 RepID=UPI000C293722|nr:hypothetical protein [Marinomonas sp. ef1]
MNIVILKEIGESLHVSKRLPNISGPVPRFLEVLNLPEEQLDLKAPNGFIVTAVTYEVENNVLIPTVECLPFLGESSIPDIIEKFRHYIVEKALEEN